MASQNPRMKVSVEGADEEAKRLLDNFRTNLSWLREERGLSYGGLNRISGLTGKSVWDWVEDGAEPYPSSLVQLGLALGVSYEDWWLIPEAFRKRYKGTSNPSVKLVVRPFVPRVRRGKNGPVAKRTLRSHRSDQRGPRQKRPAA